MHEEVSKNNLVDNVKVTVIIPVYNKVAYIEDCLKSVVNQSLQEIEILCVDDESSDGSADIIRKFIDNYEKKKGYKQIRLISLHHRGAGPARNYGMKEAQGEFIAFMDADDYYPNNNVLEDLYNIAKEHCKKVVGGSIAFLKNNRIVSAESHLRQKQTIYETLEISFRDFQFCFGFTRCIYQKDFLLENNVFFPNYMIFEDPIFFARALHEARSLYMIPNIVYIARSSETIRDLYSPKIVSDLAKGLSDVIALARDHDYMDLLDAILEESKRYKPYFCYYMINEGAGKKLDDMGLEVFFSTEEFEQYVESMKNENEYILKMASCKKNIVIYGTGRIGKTVYDVLKYHGFAEKISFAVSRGYDAGECCGKETKYIDDVIDAVDSTLFIIAAENGLEKMENTAKSLGITEMVCLDSPMVPISL